MGEEKTVVALRRCMTYDEPTVQEAVDDLFALCGGIENIVKLGQRVLVKLNLLMKRTPDRATTTHPAVARAIVRAIQNAGATAILADSPGGPFTRGMLAGVYEACGIRAVAEETGCVLNDNFSTTTRFFEEGYAARHLDLLGVLDHVDAVITVGKLKTHGLTTMTGCVKNLYGLVPGTTKVEYHARYQDVTLFSNMLLDICECVALLCDSRRGGGHGGRGPVRRKTENNRRADRQPECTCGGRGWRSADWSCAGAGDDAGSGYETETSARI